MNPYDEFDPRTGESRATIARRNFVTPGPLPLAKREPVTVDVPARVTEADPLNLAAGWTSFEGTQEHTSAMDRARALRVRLFPFVLLWALLSVIVGVLVLITVKDNVGAGLTALLTFSAMTAYTYYRLNRTDYDYSREGTERHKVDVVADLARKQMDNEYELRRQALEALERTLEGRHR